MSEEDCPDCGVVRCTQCKLDMTREMLAARDEELARVTAERDKLIERYDAGFVNRSGDGWNGTVAYDEHGRTVECKWQWFPTKAQAVRFAAGLETEPQD